MKTIFYALLICCATLCSCDRIKNKRYKLTSSVKGKVRNKAMNVADNIFPIFDANHPDTKYNKKRFTEYLGVGITNDVSSVYSLGDFLGADYKVLISFKCDSLTIQKIVCKNCMSLSKEKDGGLIFADKVDWWKEEIIEEISPYKRQKGRETLYLWYDTLSKTAYFEQYSS
jgi:hypothetical protein